MVLRFGGTIGAGIDAGTSAGSALAGRVHDLVPELVGQEVGDLRSPVHAPDQEDGVSVADLVRRVAVTAQRLAGADIDPGQTLPSPDNQRFDVLFGYEQEDVGVAAGQLAVRTLNHLIAGAEPDFDFPRELEAQVTGLAERLGYGPSTRAIVQAAARRGIPAMRLDPDRSLVQLGHGRYQRRIWTTLTSGTSDLAAKVARDKDLTIGVLRGIGIPAPYGVAVRDVDEAVRQASRIGYPVVLKPLDGNHGRGVCLDLRDEEAVRQAYPVAAGESRTRDVLVEVFVTGRDYRIVVVGGKVVAVAERVPAHVVGDGERTVAELIELANADPRRGVGHEKTLTRIVVDQATRELLVSQGMALSSVPEPGRAVPLKRTANMSTGGTAIDRTDEIHPDNARAASDAALAVGLDVAGIDFVIPDIARSHREVGGGIVEVNAGPGFRMHTHPTEGTPRPVGQAVVDMLFAEGQPARVPILAVTGTNGKTTTTRMIAHIMRAAGHTVGLTTTDGIEIDGDLIESGDMAGPSSARLVLRHPRVDCAVLETARGGMLRSGLGFDRCDVAVVTNVASDHLGLGGIDTLDQLARVKAVLPSAVFRDGASVLNADNPWTAAMAAGARGEVILFSLDEHSTVVRNHLNEHGRAIVLGVIGGDEVILLVGRGHRTPILRAGDIPATMGGWIRVNIANAMAAVAAAIAREVPIATIRDALMTFGNGYGQTPGRFNLLTIEGREVLIDYGHNVEALSGVGEFVRRTGAPHSVGVITSPGDRRDVDITAFGELAAGIFDRLVIRDGSTLRERPAGQVAGLLRDAALRAGMPADRITMIDGDIAAANVAIDLAAPGDFVHVMTERIAATWDALNERLARSRVASTD
jgi:cyanophycin synthetase